MVDVKNALLNFAVSLCYNHLNVSKFSA